MSTALAAQLGQVPSDLDGAHLIELIEKQPACLMRVALDGTLLAANQVALSLLRAASLAEVLETSFVSRFLPGQEAVWEEFASRVWKSGSGSAECDISDPQGRRTVHLNGVAWLAHPDGIDSLFLTVRDTTARRRLEEAVREAARVQALAAERERELQQARVELARLSAALRDATTDTAQVQMLADDHDRALEAAQADTNRLMAERQEALDERASLAARLAEADAVAGSASAEIVALRESLRALSPLAATGRLARQLGVELEERVRRLEDQARTVLTLTTASAAQREMLELLQKGAIEAALLAQQLSDAGRIAPRRS